MWEKVIVLLVLFHILSHKTVYGKTGWGWGNYVSLISVIHTTVNIARNSPRPGNLNFNISVCLEVEIYNLIYLA